MSMSAREKLAPLVEQRTILLRTKKRDGSWVGTPVSVVVEDDHAFFRTWSRSGKAKRLRNFSEVELCPSSAFGKPRGSWIRGHAHLLSNADDRRAGRLIVEKYPLLHRLVRAYHQVRGFETQHYIFRPAPETAASSGHSSQSAALMPSA
jgi:uncharacterized protein